MSIADLLEHKRERSNRMYGVVVGVVTNNKDEDGLGRVKVKIPRLSGDDESHWARVVSFMAGKERGAFFLPEVDDEVLVAFEHGDLALPYVIGALWNGTDVPPETNSDGENNVRVIQSRSGHIIRLNDKEGEETIEITDKTEKNSIVISTKDNKITITSDKDIELSAKNGKISLDAKDVEIKSSAGTKLEASADLDLKASGNNTIKGATVNIN
ncbi:MAG: phage tail protein [Desulfobacteraceae bacterium]|nr:MAG: phage tail protein [Desulfobacteraceae bacterium]